MLHDSEGAMRGEGATRAVWRDWTASMWSVVCMERKPLARSYANMAWLAALLLVAISAFGLTAQLQRHSCTISASQGPHSRHPGQERCIEAAVCLTRDGRLGNGLYMLERALWLARKKNYCFVIVDREQRNLLRMLINLPDDGVLRLHNGYEDWTRERIQRKCAVHCKKYTCPQFGVTYPLVKGLREVMQDNVVSRLRCNATGLPLVSLPENSLVMHVRGGDSLWSTQVTRGWYPQPPCAYWFHIMQQGYRGRPWERAHIVTEQRGPNPCIDLLRKAFPQITVQAENVTVDACTVVRARHLAISYGTWGCALARLNSDLESLYVPFGEDGWSNFQYGGNSLAEYPYTHWYRQEAVHEGPMDYAQHIYTFPKFHCFWQDQAAKRKAMVDYPSDQLVHRTIARSRT